MSEIGTQTETAAPATTAPRRLTRADRDAAAKALAAAFWDDPLMSYIWPSDRMRSSLLPVFMRGAIQLAAPHNESFTAEAQPVGGALWLPPGKTKIPLPTMLRILLPDIWRWRPGSLMRFMRIMDEFERKHVKSTHWYLMVLGVEPSRQGQGLGGLLMSDVLGRADVQGLDAYLETQKARNVPFYEKHGFQVVENFHADSGRGPECWTMLRKPRG